MRKGLKLFLYVILMRGSNNGIFMPLSTVKHVSKIIDFLAWYFATTLIHTQKEIQTHSCVCVIHNMYICERT